MRDKIKFTILFCLAIAACAGWLSSIFSDSQKKPKIIETGFNYTEPELRVVEKSKYLLENVREKDMKQPVLSSLQKRNKPLVKKENLSFDKPIGKINASLFQRAGSEWLVQNTRMNEREADNVARLASRYAHGPLLLAMLSVESDGRASLKYGNNYGLCQVSTVHLAKDEAARVKKLGHTSVRDCGANSPRDLFDPAVNLCAANAVFDRIYQESGRDCHRALVNYNANPRHKYAYAGKVMRKYNEILRLVDRKNREVALNH